MSASNRRKESGAIPPANEFAGSLAPMYYGLPDRVYDHRRGLACADRSTAAQIAGTEFPFFFFYFKFSEVFSFFKLSFILCCLDIAFCLQKKAKNKSVI